MQSKLHDRFFIMKLHSVIYNQLSVEAYRPMLHYAWQNTGYDTGEPVDNFTSVNVCRGVFTGGDEGDRTPP